MNPLLKRLHVVLVLAVVLFSAIAGAQFVNLASANPIGSLTNPDSTRPDISILSPIDNWTYTIKDVHLAFTVTVPSSWKEYYGRLSRVYYIIDAQESGNILGDMNINYEEKYYYYKILTGLSDGTHSVIVYAEGHKDWGNEDSNMVFAEPYVVYFTIDTTLPSISVLSPENTTYPTTDIPLNFTVTESTSWIGYSLDAQANVTITGNTTLPELSYGSHNLTVYANDTAGNMGYSETIYFTVAQPSEPSPIWIVAATAITAIGVAIPLGAMFYRKRRKD